MAKVAIGFVLGFLACVWTYELDATDAFVGFGHKVALACENCRTGARLASARGSCTR